MSVCIRPVVETWGESFTYLSRETEIGDLLAALVDMCDEQAETKAEFVAKQLDYGDMNVVYIHDGKRFLDWLESPVKTVDIMAWLFSEDRLSSDREEYERQKGDVLGLRTMVPDWRKSINPDDGSLRIYCD